MSYMSAHKIPITTHPGKGEGEGLTYSFHHPLSSYVEWLSKAGFMIEKIEEWCSDKMSTGKAARWENRARNEFPMFMLVVCRKVS